MKTLNSKLMVLFGCVVIMLSLVMNVQAGDPGDPVAHWAFEEGNLQSVYNNITDGLYDGYRGRTVGGESSYDAPWVSGLNGSSYALQFTNQQIVTIEDIAADTNGNRIADSGPLTGSFSMFMRVDMPNASPQYLVAADKGTGNRGFYLDTLKSAKYSGTWRLGLRFSAGAPTNDFYSNGIGGGSGDIAMTNVHSIGFTFTADSTPGDSNNDGSLQYYVNGEPFNSAVAHKAPYVGVNGAGLWIGGRWGTERGKGTIIDDVAVWDKVLTSSEMMFIHTNALPQPDPGAGRSPSYPYAHWEFDEGTGQEVEDWVTLGVNDGHRGKNATEESAYDPSWVSGLNGSSYALQFTNEQIVTIEDIAADTNADAIADSGPLTNSFSVFMRVDMPNNNAQYFVATDKGSNPRGFYFDALNGSLVDGAYRFRPRFYSGATVAFYNNPGYETGDIAFTNIHSVGFSFLVDPTPGDANSDGSLQYYVNGEPFKSPQAHKAPYVEVSGGTTGFLIGGRLGTELGKGTIIDDVAVWGKVLTGEEFYYVHNSGVPTPPPPPPGTIIIIR